MILAGEGGGIGASSVPKEAAPQAFGKYSSQCVVLVLLPLAVTWSAWQGLL